MKATWCVEVEYFAVEMPRHIGVFGSIDGFGINVFGFFFKEEQMQLLAVGLRRGCAEGVLVCGALECALAHYYDWHTKAEALFDRVCDCCRKA